jgi:SPP1 gp7 family putative phage head morphogenesis protein
VDFLTAPPTDAERAMLDVPVETEDHAIKQELRDRATFLMTSRTAPQIKTFGHEQANDIMRMVSDGIIANKTPTQIKQEITDKYDKSKSKENPQDYRIDRIVRTEMNSNMNLMKLQKWKMYGFTKYQWITVGDERVRAEHRGRNNRVYDIDAAIDGTDIFPGGSLNPEKKNINCRCTAVLFK